MKGFNIVVTNTEELRQFIIDNGMTTLNHSRFYNNKFPLVLNMYESDSNSVVERRVVSIGTGAMYETAINFKEFKEVYTVFTVFGLEALASYLESNFDIAFHRG